ncbi:hypothetical protein L6773_12900 [Rhodohalobacter sp. WB101]|uniref:MCE family protein n=2 Tax=Rhodohalobacter sulfatireducens TaxID=2911366 RepID=A0ABS9KF74_9BACT|nr:hypothetical protein [Rhodohalobacter sulfatireducens]
MVNLLPEKSDTRQTEKVKVEFIRWNWLKNVLCLFLLLTVIMISSADAQINRVEVGDRVRVTAPFVDPMERIKGTISEMSGTVLVLSHQDSLIYISDSLIQNLEVSTGKKRTIGEGVLIGAVAGTMIIGALSSLLNDPCRPTEINCSSASSNGDAFLSGAKIGLLSGITAGALTGFFVKIDVWERGPVRLGLGVAPTQSKVDYWDLEPKLSLKIPLGK